MAGKWQFSISYLLLETFWIAMVLGISGSLPSSSRQVAEFTLPALCASFGAAIGGVVGRMKTGAIVGISVWTILRLLLLVQSAL
jgi:hypothetical protein